MISRMIAIAAAAALCIGTHASIAEAAISTGESSQSATISGTSFTIYTYKPTSTQCPTLQGLVYMYHGASRSASGSRNSAEDIANAECLVVIAPLFDEARFPSASYNRGNIVNSSGAVNAETSWTTRFIDDLETWARGQVSLPTAPSYHWGYSAGAQFLSRVAAYEAKTNLAYVRRYVVAAPSTWVWPSLTEDAPYGLDLMWSDSTTTQTARLKDYLALPLTVFVGGDDDDPNDPDLSTGTAAMRQGTDREDRARNFFAAGQAYANTQGWAFNWTLVVAPGVGHSNGDAMAWSGIDAAFYSFDPLTPPTPPSTTINVGNVDSRAVTLDGVSFDVWTYRPTSTTCPNGIAGAILGFHGADRSASGVRDNLTTLANSYCQVVVAPLFDTTDFPDSNSYNRGNVVDSGGNVNAESTWSLRFVDLFADWARDQMGNEHLPYWVWGHSDGGEFAMRYAAYSYTDAARVVVANGAAMVGNLTGATAPYGYSNLPNATAKLKAFLQAPVTVYTGASNTSVNPSGIDLDSRAAALGDDRLERATNTWDIASDAALDLEFLFRWEWWTAASVGHSVSGMLGNANADDAFNLFEPLPPPTCSCAP